MATDDTTTDDGDEPSEFEKRAMDFDVWPLPEKDQMRMGAGPDADRHYKATLPTIGTVDTTTDMYGEVRTVTVSPRVFSEDRTSNSRFYVEFRVKDGVASHKSIDAHDDGKIYTDRLIQALGAAEYIVTNISGVESVERFSERSKTAAAEYEAIMTEYDDLRGV